MLTAEIRCVLCGGKVKNSYLARGAEDSIQSRWWHCQCDCLFNLCKPDTSKIFNAEYRKGYEDKKEIDVCYDWYLRNFITIIEERTYGRRFLDVGFCTPIIINKMKERGWISTGIDLIPNEHITGDFETYDFKQQKFDFIMLCDVLQCFNNPMEALRKAYDLLFPTGLMLIITPNTDLIKLGTIGEWGHLNMEENRMFLSDALIEKMIQRVSPSMKGSLEIIYKANNCSQRFLSWNNVNIIAQKISHE